MNSEWPLVSLKEVTSVLGDGLHGTPEYDLHGDHFFINGNNLSNGKIIFSAATKRVSATEAAKHKKNLTDRTILVSINGTLGNVAFYAGEKVVLGKSACYFNVVDGVDKHFIRYVLDNEVFQGYIHNLAAGSTIKNVSLKLMRDFQFRLPPIPAQQRIAGVLKAFDDRITLLRETNTTLEAIAQVLFKSWFVDFDPVHAKMQGRTSEGMDEETFALFPDSLQVSELGDVPKGWQFKTMADISTVSIGKTPPRKEPQWFSEDSSDIRWVSIRDMGMQGIYASQTSEFLTKEAIQKFNVRVVPDNTVLMSFKMTIGRVALTDGEITTNEAIAHFNLNDQSLVTSEFIYLHLKQFDFSTLSSTSSIADAVNSKVVREIPILVPSTEVMVAFQARIVSIFNKLKLSENQAQNLATLRNALLPRLICGDFHQIEEAIVP
jgi:type I restriction enzyme S subunit